MLAWILLLFSLSAAGSDFACSQSVTFYFGKRFLAGCIFLASLRPTQVVKREWKKTVVIAIYSDS